MTRMRRSLDRKDAGFTLIELLVVIIIIGILAAIAIPVFLNQRQKGHDAAAQSDIHNAAIAEESYFASHGVYADIVKVNQDQAIPLSKGTTLVSLYVDPSKGFCLGAIQSDGSPLPASQAALSSFSSSVVWWYDSQKGGLQPRNVPIDLASFNLGCGGTNPSTGANALVYPPPSVSNL